MTDEHARSPSVQVFGALTGDEEIEALAPSVRDGWMGMGPRVRAFEAAIGKHIDADFVMTSSGSSALDLAVRALDLSPGAEVIVPSLTWVTCAHAVIAAGLTPVFADVDLNSHNVTAEEVQRVRTARTAAVMVVHYAGKPVAFDDIEALGLPVIEDAAHAIDSRLRDRACGTLGTVGIYSFDSVKNLATPDGGGVTSPVDDVLERARNLRYCGITASGFARRDEVPRWWEHEITGTFQKATPNDVAASVGLIQLERLAANQARRRELWDTYQRELAALEWLVRPLDPAADERHSYFTYLIRVVDGNRDELAAHLLRAGVYTTFRYQPLHLSPYFGATAALPACELLAEQGLNLPLHPRMTDADMTRVIALLRATKAGRGR